MLTSPRSLATSFLASLALLLALAGPAPAQEGVAVRVAGVKGIERADEQTEHAIPADLAPLARALESLPYRRFERLTWRVKRVSPGTTHTFELPDSYLVEVLVQEAPDGWFELEVEVTRPSERPDGGRVRVVATEVRLRAGTTYVIERLNAFGRDTSLLILITAAQRDLE